MSFRISCGESLLVKNRFSFDLSENILISLSVLKNFFTRYRILGWLFFFLQPFKDVFPSPASFQSNKKSVVILIATLFAMQLFSLAALNIFSLFLILIFNSLIMMCLGVVFFDFILLKFCWATWIFGSCFLNQIFG